MTQLLSVLATLTKDAQLEVTAASAAAPTVVSSPSPSSTPPPIATALAGFQIHGPWVAGTLYLVVPIAPLSVIPEARLAEDEDQRLWYCISKDTYIGVHTSHALAVAAVSGVSGSAMKSYKTQILAVDAFNELLGYHGMVAICP
ncbi:hypothetical protein DFH07DRAFT_767875 [Mycena maculata]|uniref:Uncharacterized protein n=1 Tax=Mycena maculata TaxID=230809 RepID=A0AAD7NRI0_9AGAR|nr:hypothetical protein DFH07DRAFT_767875 [Mycena maculata]